MSLLFNFEREYWNLLNPLFDTKLQQVVIGKILKA